MLKRDLSYDLFSRELQALDELFSREPEDLAQWTKRSWTSTTGPQTNGVTSGDPRHHVPPGPPPSGPLYTVTSTTGPQTVGIVKKQ